MVHRSRASQNKVLRGTLSKDDLTVPFSMRMEADLLRFYFDNPAQIINLNLKQKGTELTEAVAGSNKPVPPGRYAEGIRGTDLSYDDVSLRYLYWPNPVKLPETERVKTRKCWIVELPNPQKSGEYGYVRIWVDKANGSLLMVRGFNRQNQLVKELKVTSGMKVDGVQVLQAMDVFRFVPGTSRLAGETTFKLQKPK